MTEKARNLGNEHIFRSDAFWISMNKRELFAAMAMQGLMSDPTIENFEHGARTAVRCADALLEELCKTEGDE